MGEHRLGALGMMLGRADAAAVGRAQDHGAAQPPLGSVAQPRRVIHQLIDAGIDEAHELNLADGLEALRRHADAQPADQQLRKRGVDHALGAESLLQPDGGAEDAAVDADVFAEHDDVGILFHGAGKRQIDGFDQRDLRHRSLR